MTRLCMTFDYLLWQIWVTNLHCDLRNPIEIEFVLKVMRNLFVKQTLTRIQSRFLSALWIFCPIKYLSKLGSSEKQTLSDPTCYSHDSHQIKIHLHYHKCVLVFLIFHICFISNIFAQWPGSVSNNVKTEKFKGFICCGFKASFVITTLHWHWTKWNIIFLWI